jgi:hypothetical protein
MMQKMASGFEELMKNSSSADVVANVVLKAVKDENSNLRYLAGNDVEQCWELKETCLMKNSIK